MPPTPSRMQSSWDKKPLPQFQCRSRKHSYLPLKRGALLGLQSMVEGKGNQHATRYRYYGPKAHPPTDSAAEDYPCDRGILFSCPTPILLLDTRGEVLSRADWLSLLPVAEEFYISSTRRTPPRISTSLFCVEVDIHNIIMKTTKQDQLQSTVRNDFSTPSHSPQ